MQILSSKTGRFYKTSRSLVYVCRVAFQQRRWAHDPEQVGATPTPAINQTMAKIKAPWLQLNNNH